jgi:hypothetical protein
LKETTRSAQWLLNAGVTSVRENLCKLQAHANHYEGLKDLMIDCSIVTFNCMTATFPPECDEGSDSDDSDLNPTYPFETRLMTIAYNRRMFEQATDEGPIDLTD